MDRTAEIFKKAVDHLRSIANDVVSVLKKSQDATTEAVKAIKIPAVDMSPVVRAIKEKEAPEAVSIKNTDELTAGVIEAVKEVTATLQNELKNFDKEVVVNNDYTGVVEAINNSGNRDAVLASLQALGDRLDKPEREEKDYTDTFKEMIACMSDKTSASLLKELLAKEYSVQFPSIFDVNLNPLLIDDYRVRVSLPDEQVDKMSRTVVTGMREGLATEEKQDDLITAIQNITIPAPAGGATETTQLEVLDAIQNQTPPAGGATEDRQIEYKEKFNEFTGSLKREDSGELNTIDENLRKVLGTERLVTNKKLNVNAIPEYTVKTVNLRPVTNSLFMVDVTGFNSLAIQLSGTWAGTITFECSSTGFDMYALNGIAVNGTAILSSATANGIYRFNVAGLTYVQARFSTATSGSPICSFIMSPEASSIIANQITIPAITGAVTTTDSILPTSYTPQAGAAKIIPVAPATQTSGISNFLTKFPQYFNRLRVESGGSERLPFAQEPNTNKILVSNDDERLLLQDILEQLKISNSLKMQELDWNGLKNLKIPEGYKEI